MRYRVALDLNQDGFEIDYIAKLTKLGEKEVEELTKTLLRTKNWWISQKIDMKKVIKSS